MILLILPVLLTFLHSTLQNFTAAIPTHHCRPPADTNLSKDGDLEAWLPRDGAGAARVLPPLHHPAAGTALSQWHRGHRALPPWLDLRQQHLPVVLPPS
uniref:Uncharacterized protein n=1 Tax=Rangifer tarandus platyrhynchus TaxID=3082113 RepID=A0ACB0EWY9_RANTA|nr:unnamed protein product [Rangifer tarandus platyrhynchus]